MNKYSGDRVYWIIFIAPALLIVSLFFIIPVIGGFIYSLTDWNGLDKTINFIGLENYKNLILNNKRFYSALTHTLIFSFSITILQNCFGLILALVMDKNFKGRNFFRAVYYLPSVLSALVVSYAWSFILNPTMGALNVLFKKIGLNFLVQDWLGDAKLALFSIIFVVVWQYAGYSMVIYIAGLQNIPLEMYEASSIDGVNAWQKFRYITFPLLAPAFTINILLTMISTLKTFDHIFVMTKGGPGYATEVISTLLYRESFTNNNMGYGSAISVILFALITSVSLITLKYLRRRETAI
ncbi:MAG TPA: sugar ABC transporter permease [Clostridiaceae bacterium]|nr:sugar ABC transporter permease [Clostridiaceae bacterium]